MKRIDLGKITVPVDQYAAQGNAVLGIRGSGKSYSATYIAERLLDAGVPIVAFDPIGIWRFLRVPADGGHGYKVVVAGGEHGDIPLPANGAAEIMRAAMKDGVSIVFDLYDINLSKGDWRRVVESAVKVLLYENKAHGLRHIFMEEAAEFCPQRVGPEQGSVYSAIERLARMGGNAQLGYTLINQRAEEVNKAVLELCDLLILHRQKGRNSLTALSKWLDVAQAKGEIAEKIPVLDNGECYIWPAGDAQPVRTKIPAKRTFHPDRKAMAKAVAAEAKSADVSAFVVAMRESLQALAKEADENDPKKLKAKIRELERQLASREVLEKVVEVPVLKNGQLDRTEKIAERLQEHADRFLAETAELRRLIAPAAAPRPAARAAVRVPAPARPAAVSRPAQSSAGLTGPEQRILDAIAWLESVGNPQPELAAVAFVAGYTVGGGAFNNPRGALRTKGLIEYRGERLALTDAGRALAKQPDSDLTAEELQRRVMERLPGPERKILSVLINTYPKALPNDELAERAGYAVGGAFNNPRGRLRSLGLIDYPQPGFAVARPVLFLEA